MSDGTVLDKTTRLGQRLDRLAEEKNKANETSWLPQQIANLRESLNTLRAQLLLARAVSDVVGLAQIDLKNIDAGFKNFKKRADDDASYPTRDSWRTAINRVTSIAGDVAERTYSTWRTWADARLAELPTDQINLISGEQAKKELDEMRKMAVARTIEPGYVPRFQQLLTTMHTRLDDTPIMPPEVASALRLFDLLDTVTLHDLTGEHIDALRRSELDKRIVLHWKDA